MSLTNEAYRNHHSRRCTKKPLTPLILEVDGGNSLDDVVVVAGDVELDLNSEQAGQLGPLIDPSPTSHSIRPPPFADTCQLVVAGPDRRR